jgi:hypothetical protein
VEAGRAGRRHRVRRQGGHLHPLCRGVAGSDERRLRRYWRPSLAARPRPTTRSTRRPKRRRAGRVRWPRTAWAFSRLARRQDSTEAGLSRSLANKRTAIPVVLALALFGQPPRAPRRPTAHVSASRKKRPNARKPAASNSPPKGVRPKSVRPKSARRWRSSRPAPRSARWRARAPARPDGPLDALDARGLVAALELDAEGAQRGAPHRHLGVAQEPSRSRGPIGNANQRWPFSSTQHLTGIPSPRQAPRMRLWTASISCAGTRCGAPKAATPSAAAAAGWAACAPAAAGETWPTPAGA